MAQVSRLDSHFASQSICERGMFADKRSRGVGQSAPGGMRRCGGHARTRLVDALRGGGHGRRRGRCCARERHLDDRRRRGRCGARERHLDDCRPRTRSRSGPDEPRAARRARSGARRARSARSSGSAHPGPAAGRDDASRRRVLGHDQEADPPRHHVRGVDRVRGVDSEGQLPGSGERAGRQGSECVRHPRRRPTADRCPGPGSLSAAGSRPARRGSSADRLPARRDAGGLLAACLHARDRGAPVGAERCAWRCPIVTRARVRGPASRVRTRGRDAGRAATGDPGPAGLADSDSRTPDPVCTGCIPHRSRRPRPCASASQQAGSGQPARARSAAGFTVRTPPARSGLRGRQRSLAGRRGNIGGHVVRGPLRSPPVRGA